MRAATTVDVSRYADVEDSNVTLGSPMYLVAWEGWDSSYNTWEPDSFIVDDELIMEYEARADAAEDEAAELELDEAEEVAAEEAAEEALASPTGGEGKREGGGGEGGGGECGEGDAAMPMETEEVVPAPAAAAAIDPQFEELLQATARRKAAEAAVRTRVAEEVRAMMDVGIHVDPWLVRPLPPPPPSPPSVLPSF